MISNFGCWLKRAGWGDRYVYFTGNLAEARQMGALGEIAMARNLAREAFHAYHTGLVTLTQERVDKETCRYIATRTRQMRHFGHRFAAGEAGREQAIALVGKCSRGSAAHMGRKERKV